MNKYKCWSKRETTPKGEKSIEVEEIDNGFIITFCEYKNSEDGEYKEPERKKLYSKENPLADMEPEVTKESLKDFFNPPLYEG